MPLIALDKSTGERVDITTISMPRVALRSADIVCPVCDSPMIIKAGMINRAHFAHKPGRNDDCPYAHYSNGETQEHRDAKELIRNRLSEWFVEYGVATPALEVWIPEVVHARNRIADVLFTFPGGWRVAHEVQLASITAQELQERTEDYENAGIDVFWWFGRDAAKDSSYQWSMQRYGFVLKVGIFKNHARSETILYSGAAA